MKKLIAMLLALVMVLALTGCSLLEKYLQDPAEAPIEEVTETPTEEVTEPPIEETTETPVADSASVNVLNNIWNLFAEDQKFLAFGGDMNHMVDGAAGIVDITDTNNLEYQLLVPADQAANIDEAAGLFHGMMLNNFTAGVFHATGDAKAFGETMYGAVSTNSWMCGFPEKMVIAVVDGEYVVMAYGLGEVIDNFTTHMTTAYPDAEILYNEEIFA